MDSNRKTPRSLIMCVTPLQMIIAEKVIELNIDKDFDLIVIALSHNDKYTHYYNRLNKKCLDSIYYISETGLKGFFGYTKKIKESNLNKDYQEIYLASIDSRHFQYIISKNSLAQIYTFDDGLANIISNDIYYSDIEPNIWKKAIWYLLGIRYYMKDIKKLSIMHYTIYEDIPNIIGNTKLIKLYEEEEEAVHTNTSVKIYLGQPLLELSNKIDNSYVEDVLNKIKIDFYYPHPREKEIPLGDFDIIDSMLVFEDYIIEYLKCNPKVSVEVYSFISTAILNISHLNRVSAKYIYNSYLYDSYKEFYDFIEKELKIDYIDLNV
ncbi:glycosyltransferase family 52 [Psychrobacter sp. DAB_AL43B]|uniref:glycosyltransferase family 52 n=1 Tax=Psychrobacter sp. DAB_AL43B TaxID=1028416 RepID=UPI0009A8EE4F|nr:glycosyltransferase family 52 [Psychrobacter sp. DAB_AL43B]SLJ83938.1 CMP-N-acetylneuraminate-beta-galactosamide-alpha-2,3-sialyltransferase [Psychrobacter sp. DAB_AL43B]